MDQVGLVPLVKYEELPVSGFGDVVPRYFSLRKNFKKLASALESPLCKGLVAIDYPGFNMKLTALANQLEKPVLYVAPPQAWAWKPHRAKKLNHPKNCLALFFNFEKPPYEKAGCHILQMQHPLITAIQNAKNSELTKDDSLKKILLFPGSRKSQTFRNLPLFLEMTENFLQASKVVIVAPRQDLLVQVQQYLEERFCKKIPSNLSVELAPSLVHERIAYYGEAALALSTPGTVTLELALAGCNTVVCTKPDFLTYTMGKRLIKIKWFSLPNLILEKTLFPEFIRDGLTENVKQQIKHHLTESFGKKIPEEDVTRLKKILSTGKTSEQLMSEFLAQFV